MGEGPAGKSKEWVASNDAVENPTVAPLINILDQAQRAGNIRSFDLGKYLMTMQGRQLGGSISVPTPYQVRTNSVSSLPPSRAENGSGTQGGRIEQEMLSLLRDLRDKGIPASVSLSEIDQKQQLREQSRKFAKK